MASQAKWVFRQEMALARVAYAAHHWDESIHHVERAHVVGQRYFWAHLLTHIWMLRIALVRRDLREVFGQIMRILAVTPGYVFGWVPVGNTGGANVSPIQPMPIPHDLKSSFVGYCLKHEIGRRVVVFALVLVLARILVLMGVVG